MTLLIGNISTFLNYIIKGKEMNENSYEDYQALINANCMGSIFYIDLELSAGKNFTDLCQHGVWHYNNDTSSIMIREIKEIDGNCGFSKVGIKMILSFANWTDCIQLYKIIHANNEPNWEEVNLYFIENAVKYFAVLTNCNDVNIVDAFEISTELERISTMQ
jgi:hypothetical protein